MANLIKPDEMFGYDFIGTETRSQVIGSALWDIRVSNPHANVTDVQDCIERYLDYWEVVRSQIQAGIM